MLSSVTSAPGIKSRSSMSYALSLKAPRTRITCGEEGQHTRKEQEGWHSVTSASLVANEAS